MNEGTVTYDVSCIADAKADAQAREDAWLEFESGAQSLAEMFKELPGDMQPLGALTIMMLFGKAALA